MDDAAVWDKVQRLLAGQAPILLVYVGGLLVALRLRRRAPGASLWAAAAFVLGILACALIVLGQAGGNEVATHLVGPVLQAVACVLLLIGVYAGRPSPSVEPSGSSESVWQNVSQVARARPGLLIVFSVQTRAPQ